MMFRVQLKFIRYLLAFSLGFLLSQSIRFVYGESSTCLTVYKQGGAPAVFQSPKCPRWKLSDSHSPTTTAECQSAKLQGRRKSQEDRTLCALDIRIPFPGKTGIKEIMVGLIAVFDGHNGVEASEMASKLLLEYFVLHAYFLLDAAYSDVLKRTGGRLLNERYHHNAVQVLNGEEILAWHGFDFGRLKNSLQAKFDDSSHLKILKEALLRAICDIDKKFSEEAFRNNLHAGSTATIVLVADGKILVANIGDSKAFLCSKNFQSPAEAKASFLRLYRRKERDGSLSHMRDNYKYKLASSKGREHFLVKELTSDHHPDREDERIRVETAGGHVLSFGGVLRVNGQLAITRAIGDVSFKSYGVISAPEVTDWQVLTANDSYIVAASDGVFEKLTSQDVCDLLWEVQSSDTLRSEFATTCSYSLADYVVNAALEKGSMDNVATVVAPLRPVGFSASMHKERSIGVGDMDFDCSTFGLEEFVHKSSANGITSDLLQLEHVHPLNAKFERISVEVKHGRFGCFYLSENLDEPSEYTWKGNNEREDSHYQLPKTLPDVLDHHSGGPVNLYSNMDFCFHLGMTVDGAKDQCGNLESFANFLGLLESFSFRDTGSNNESFYYSMPDLRYVSKKRFGRGSYGEVWLAFHWNCHQGVDYSRWNGENNSASFSFPNYDSYNSNSSSSTHGNNGPANPKLFILKRILVERGTAVYLSGLREKYFGEIFLNASMSLQGLRSAAVSESVFERSQLEYCSLVEKNRSNFHDIRSMQSSGNSLQNDFILKRAVDDEGLNYIARYVESFESRSNEIWLVFHYEGVSLTKLLYTVEEENKTVNGRKNEQVNHVQMLRPSKWWHWLKTTDAGQEQMRKLIWQLLMALKSCHDRNITHRDIKPENMVICFEDQETGRCLEGIPSSNKNHTTKMRIIDFGSGINDFTLKHLYSTTGPSRAEQTYEYTPPEALLNATWYLGPTSSTLKYDMWSVGVVMLELVLGTPNVFQLSAFMRTLLDQHLEGWNTDLKELAHKLRSFMELCILIPGSSLKNHHTVHKGGVSPASWKCSEEFFSSQIKSRDPLKLGFSDILALRLVRQLLVWDPEDRLSVEEALQHPYFQPSPRG